MVSLLDDDLLAIDDVQAFSSRLLAVSYALTCKVVDGSVAILHVGLDVADASEGAPGNLRLLAFATTVVDALYTHLGPGSEDSSIVGEVDVVGIVP